MTESSNTIQVATPVAEATLCRTTITATACGSASSSRTTPPALVQSPSRATTATDWIEQHVSATSTCVSASRLVESRVGRELQRYDGATRLLACVVVMRMVDEQAQVLIISSSKHPNEWILPKGGWETDETLVECALREAEEEAGIGGEVVEELGAIDFSSKQGKRCRFYGFKVSVRKEFQKWAESNRQRKWVSVEEGKQILSDRPELLAMLVRASR